MKPRIQGGGETSTSGRDSSPPSQPSRRRPRWPSFSSRQSRPLHGPFIPCDQHVESCSVALGLPPLVPMQRGSLRAALEQLDSPMQARQRLKHLSSLLLVPSWQARELVLSSPQLLTLKPQTVKTRVQHLAAFVASCPPPPKARRQEDEEVNNDSASSPEELVGLELQGLFSSLLVGWSWPGEEEASVGPVKSTLETNQRLTSSVLFGFMPQELDTLDPPFPPPQPSPVHPKLKNESQVLSVVSSLICREPRLLISPADACHVVLALMEVTGLELKSVSTLIYRRPILICRAQGARVKRGREGGGGVSSWSWSSSLSDREVVMKDGDDRQGAVDHMEALMAHSRISDHVEAFSATIDLLERIFPSSEMDHHRSNLAQKGTQSRGRTKTPLISHRRPSPRVVDLLVKEPSLLTVPLGSIMASISAILDAFPSLSHSDMKGDTEGDKIINRTRPLTRMAESQSSIEGNAELWCMVERCPELLCSSPSAVEGSCRRLSYILRKSKTWSKALPKLISKPRNLAVAIALGFDTALLDRLTYLSDTNRDRSMDFKEAMAASTEDFADMWPGFGPWAQNLNNS